MKTLRFWEIFFFFVVEKLDLKATFYLLLQWFQSSVFQTKQWLFSPWGLNLQLSAETQPASLNSRLWTIIRSFSQHGHYFVLLNPCKIWLYLFCSNPPIDWMVLCHTCCRYNYTRDPQLPQIFSFFLLLLRQFTPDWSLLRVPELLGAAKKNQCVSTNVCYWS